MEPQQIGVAGGDDRAARIFGRLAIVVLIAAASALSVTTNAFAADTLSSVVLSQTEPGLTAAPSGPFNGPLTSSNLAQVTGNSGQGESDFAQLLTSGDLTAYVRVWGHQPADGDAVVITAFQFAHAADESAFASSLDSTTESRPGATAFAVPAIPGAIGSATHVSTSGTTLTEYAIFFQKGGIVFELQMATSSGDLTSANAVTLADQQFANAPATPAPSGGTNLSGLRVVLACVGLVLTVTTIVIGRTRKYPLALTGFGAGLGINGTPPAFAPPGPWGSPSPQTANSATQEPPKVGVGQWQ